jgi:hypothetical protein
MNLPDTPPDLVKGTYTTDLNINKIHEAIVVRYEYFHKSVGIIEERIIHITKKIDIGDITFNEKCSLESEINNLKKGMYDYQNNISYNNYYNETKDILNEYNKVASNKSKGVIIFHKIKEEEDEEIIKKRVKIIQDYLDIAKKYIKIEIIHKKPNKFICPICGNDLNKTFIDEDSGLCICQICGYERESISHVSTFKDIQRLNLGNKNNYEDCENFRKALLRFQGKQTHRPPPKLYEQLDDYFTKLGKGLSIDVKRLSLNDKGQKDGTSRQMMFEALSEINNTAYYDDINLILHIYWGWELPNISHLEEKIMEDYFATQKVYNSIPNKDRNASLNIQFRLFVHIKAVGYPCSKNDFKIQTSRDSLIFHNEMWKIMCEKTGIKFYSVI